MKTSAIAIVTVLVLPTSFILPAQADDSKTGIYEVSEIYVLPSAMASKQADIPGLMSEMMKDTKGDEGLVSIKLTQQIGQTNNYTLIEQWKDQASLDKHTASGHTKAFYSKLEPLISGPVYQRDFSVYQ